MKKNIGKRIRNKNGGFGTKKIKGGGIKKLGNNIEISLDPLTILLFGIIGFLMYQILKKDQDIDKYIQINDVDDYDFNPIYVEESNNDPVLKKPYRKNNEMTWANYLDQRPKFNMPTRGMPNEYESVGYLKDDTGNLQKLVGRETYRGSNLWNYFTMSSDYNQIPIPLHLDNNDCTDERGCSQIYDNQSVNIDGSDKTATIYNKQPYRYIPTIY
jgi:hypothetical protein